MISGTAASTRFLVLVLLGLVLSHCGQDLLSSSPPEAVRPYIEVKRPGILKSFDAFYILPVDIYSIEGDALQRISDDEVIGLGEEFRARLIRKLGDRAAPLPQPTANVANVRVGLMDVSSTYADFQILPGAVFPNALRAGASIQAEFFNSVTNERVALIRESRQADRRGYFSGLRKWDGVETHFDSWTQLLSQAVRR